jgi:sensor histidine kinase regulating citrate/malate metabolism
VTSRIEDPALAALLIAKSSLAAERGVSLQLAEESRLGKVDEELSRDLTTVVGNLVDNALDAVTNTSEAKVVVLIGEDDGGVRVDVRDSGPGVPAEFMDDIFRQGFSTKNSPDGGRGYGLALARVVCQRRGGRLTVRNDHGAVFTALLMRKTADA